LPNIKSAEKRLRKSAAQRNRNRDTRSEIRTQTKKLLQTEVQADAEQTLRDLSSLLDRAARKNVISKQHAARQKSRLTRYVSRLGG